LHLWREKHAIQLIVNIIQQLAVGLEGESAPVEDAFEGKGVGGVPFAAEDRSDRRAGLAAQGGPRGEVQQAAPTQSPHSSAAADRCQCRRLQQLLTMSQVLYYI
jgi:hypothetical protein